MNRILTVLLLAALSFTASAEVWQARYGVAEVFNFKLYNADGTLDTDEADGGTEVSLSCNEGAEATATNDFVDEGTFYSISLTAAELQCERIAVVIAATTTEVFFIQTHSNASAMTPTADADIQEIGGSAVSTSTAQLGVNVVNAAGTAWGSGAITAASIATDAIGAAEVAADAIGASELATGAITTAEFAAGAINAAAIAADAIGASEVAADVSTELLTGLANLAVNVAQISGDSGAADELELAFDGAAGAVEALGIARQGTAQSATATTLVLDSSASFADDTTIGMTLVACGSTQGYCQSEAVTDYVSATDTATVDTWPVTPSGTITYYLFATAPGSSGSGATAQEVWEYATRSLTIFDEDSTTIDINGTTIGTATTAGTVNAIAANAITAAATAADFGTEIGTATWATTTRSLTILDEDSTTLDLNATPVGAAASVTAGVTLTAAGIDAIWDEPQSGHVTADTFGAYLDSSVSGVSTGGVSAADIADAVWDEALSGHATAGTSGLALSDVLTDTSTTLDDLVDDLEGRLTSTRAGYLDNLSGGAVATSSALSTLSTTVGAAGAGLTAIPWNSSWDAEVQSEALDALNALTITEPAGVPSWGGSLASWIGWIGAWSRNEISQSTTTKTLRNDADSANLATCAVSDVDSTFTVSECQ